MSCIAAERRWVENPAYGAVRKERENAVCRGGVGRLLVSADAVATEGELLQIKGVTCRRPMALGAASFRNWPQTRRQSRRTRLLMIGREAGAKERSVAI